MNETGKQGYIRTETVPTKAQIEAARKVLRNSSCFCDEVCSLLPCKCVEAALTAAAEVGCGIKDPPCTFDEGYRYKEAECKEEIAATIERCAQVAERYNYDASPQKIADGIRALLKDKP